MLNDSDAECPSEHSTLNIQHSTFRAKRGQRGFTLIELIVVVTIIGILAAIAVANVKNAQNRARESALKDDLRTMRSAIDNFYADKQHYPQSLQELKQMHYLRDIPKDPMTMKADWEENAATADPNDPSASDQAVDPTAVDPNNANGGGQPGIIDVHSLAPGKAMNGESFHDW
jgi:general secretion pathway protein G